MNLKPVIFKAIKNKGYNLEHNYGHGEINLNVNFASLMYLAFLIDQVEEETCELFQKSYEKLFTKVNLWEKIRSIFKFFDIENWTQILQAILTKNRIKVTEFINST